MCGELQDWKERVFENFLEAWDDLDFQDLVKCELYSSEALWIEKEYGRADEDEFTRVYDMVFEWDPEGMHNDPKLCFKNYIADQVSKKRGEQNEQSIKTRSLGRLDKFHNRRI